MQAHLNGALHRNAEQCVELVVKLGGKRQDTLCPVCRRQLLEMADAISAGNRLKHLKKCQREQEALSPAAAARSSSGGDAQRVASDSSPRAAGAPARTQLGAPAAAAAGPPGAQLAADHAVTSSAGAGAGGSPGAGLVTGAFSPGAFPFESD